MSDDAEYEMERLEEERKWLASQRSDSESMSHLIDNIVDNHIPASKSTKPSEPRVERI